MPRSTIAALAVGLALLSGCAKGPPEITILTGKVTIDGKPVTAGTVNVISDDGVTRTAGELAPDGTYSIVGAPVGPVTFSVSTEEHKVIHPEPGSAGREPRKNPRYVATPSKYEKFETSGLTTTIPKGAATYNVELASK